MNRRVAILAALLVFAFVSTGLAQGAPDPVVAELELFHVTLDEEGKEILTPAETVRPGELLEYRLVTSNRGDAAVGDLQPVLPVPVGLELLIESAGPGMVLATRDGSRFDPVPLMATVTLPDGTVEDREVPASEYRALKWVLGDLAPGASAVVSARMRVVTESAAVPEIPETEAPLHRQ